MGVNKSSAMATYLSAIYKRGIGEVAVKVPRVRDRGKEDIKFSSNLIPQYMRRTVTIDVLYSVQNKIRTFESDNIEIFCH